MQLPDIDLSQVSLNQGLAVFIVLFMCAWLWSLRKPLEKWLLAAAAASQVAAKEMPEIRKALGELLRTVDSLVKVLPVTLSSSLLRIEGGMDLLLRRAALEGTHHAPVPGNAVGGDPGAGVRRDGDPGAHGELGSPRAA